MKRFTWLLMLILSVALFGAGLARGEWQTVKGYAITLCTACIGLTGEAG